MTPEPGHDTDPQALRAALRRHLASAMKARELDAVSALRTAIAAIDNAEAVPAPEQDPATTSGHIAGARAGIGAAEAARRDLSGGQQRAILRDQITGYTAEADRYEALGRPDAAARLRAQASLLSAYLLSAYPHRPGKTCTDLAALARPDCPIHPTGFCIRLLSCVRGGRP
jgi:hypothetical protein